MWGGDMTIDASTRTEEFLVVQGTQHRVPGGLLGLVNVLVVGGRIQLRLGVGTAWGRRLTTVAVGESKDIGIGRVTAKDAHFGIGKERAQAVLLFEPSLEQTEVLAVV
jgi:hypothetical protein